MRSGSEHKDRERALEERHAQEGALDSFALIAYFGDELVRR